ncbi:MAG TPA: hypothetical protein VG056_02450 [Pirellulales bacterium]|nr:hypothetical protein [Pirellulales bacterium]
MFRVTLKDCAQRREVIKFAERAFIIALACYPKYGDAAWLALVKESNGGPAGVLAHHLAELRTSGLSDATIAAAGIRSESNYGALAAILNWRKLRKRIAAAIVFPFRRPDGSNGHSRLSAN